MNAIAQRASVLLDADTVLRIRDGRGTRLSCAGGVIWITQEGSANDTVLEAGGDVTLEFDGTTLAGGHRGAVVVEIHAGRVPPALVETTTTDGTGWRLFPHGSRFIAALRRGAARVVDLLEQANARNRGWDDTHAVVWSDGLPTRAVRRVIMRDLDARASMTDRSMLWRHL